MKSNLSLAALSAALLWIATATAEAGALTDAGPAQTALTALQSDAGTFAAVEADAPIDVGPAQTALTALRSDAGTFAGRGIALHRLPGVPTALQSDAGTFAAVEADAPIDVGLGTSGKFRWLTSTAIKSDEGGLARYRCGTFVAVEADAPIDAGPAQTALTALQSDAGTYATVKAAESAMHNAAPDAVASQFA